MTGVVVSARFGHLLKAPAATLADMTAASAAAVRQATAQNVAQAIVEASAKARGVKSSTFTARAGLGGDDSDLVDADELSDAEVKEITSEITKAGMKAFES